MRRSVRLPVAGHNPPNWVRRWTAGELLGNGSRDAGRLGLPPWPEALELLAELNRVLRALAEEHQALVADVHARFLGHGLAAGDPTQPAARPPDRRLWVLRPDRAQRLACQRDPASFWDALWGAGTR